MPRRPLWQCPKCRRRFANRNQSHACGRCDLEHHFSRKPPQIRALFDDIVAAIRRIGPVRILPEKTRIAFQGACPSRRSRRSQSGWMVMSFSHAGSSIRAFVRFRLFRRAITFIAFGLLHRVTLTRSSRLGSRKHILLVSNATLKQKVYPIDEANCAIISLVIAVGHLWC